MALIFPSALSAGPKYVDGKLKSLVFVYVATSSESWLKKMFLAWDEAGLEMPPSVLNMPQIVVWKPFPSNSSQFAILKKKCKGDSIASYFSCLYVD